MRLIIEGLTVARAGQPVLDGIDIVVSAGTCLVIRGANGAGKSTLLRAVAGLIGHEAGDIRLDGGGADIDIGAQCHYVGHANAMRRGQPVREALRFWASYLDQPASDDVIAQWLGRLGLTDLERVPVGMLSAGQQRRLGFARLLAAQRPVWLLDEPTTAVDAGGRAMLEALITSHLAHGGLALVTTHTPITVTPSLDYTLSSRARAVA